MTRPKNARRKVPLRRHHGAADDHGAAEDTDGSQNAGGQVPPFPGSASSSRPGTSSNANAKNRSEAGGNAGPGGNAQPDADSIPEYHLCSSDPPALKIWSDLTREEKVEVMDITPQELASKLSSYAAAQLDVNKSAEQLVDSKEVMGAVRAAFVYGVNNAGNMPITSDVVALLLIHIMETHLMIAHARKVGQIKLIFAAIVYSLFVPDYHWAIRLSIGGAFVYAGWSSRQRVYAAREIVMLPFEDKDPERMSARLQALCCGLFNLSLGWWVPWYTAVIAVSAAPLLVIEVERGISAATDQKALRYIRMALAWAASLLYLYFAWFSTLLFIFGLVFFLPTALRFSVIFSLLGLDAALTYTGKAYDWFAPWLPSKHRTSTWIIWGRFIGAICALYFGWSILNWTLIVLLSVTILLLVPARPRTIALGVARLGGTMLLAQQLDTILVLRLSVVAVLLAWVFIKAMWRRYVRRRKADKPGPSSSRPEAYNED